jgi:hypothetical protein
MIPFQPTEAPIGPTVHPLPSPESIPKTPYFFVVERSRTGFGGDGRSITEPSIGKNKGIIGMDFLTPDGPDESIL